MEAVLPITCYCHPPGGSCYALHPGDLKVAELRRLARAQGLKTLAPNGRKADLLEALAS
jgi:hypothetical protein